MLCLISGAIHYRIKASNWSQLNLRAAFKKLFPAAKSSKVKRGGVSIQPAGAPGPLAGAGCTARRTPPHPLAIFSKKCISIFLPPRFPPGAEPVQSCAAKNNARASPGSSFLRWLSTGPRGLSPAPRTHPWVCGCFIKERRTEKKAETGRFSMQRPGTRPQCLTFGKHY